MFRASGYGRILSVLPAIGAVLCAAPQLLALTTIELELTDDALVRASYPTLNYGQGGGLAVAGDSATNGAGQSQGRYDSVLKFNTLAAVAELDSIYGVGQWVIQSVSLYVNEQGAPNNPMFNRGIGNFQVLWLADDNWVEGPGKPNAPPVGSGNQMTYDLLQTLLAPAGAEVGLGVFANEGADGARVYELGTPAELLADLAGGGPVSLHMAPATGTIGFTFSSGENTWDTHPALVIAAVPEPAGALLAALALAFCRQRRDRSGKPTP